MQLTPEWDDSGCSDGGTRQSPIFSDDNVCVYGIGKHHYHCRTCGKVVQVG